MAKQTAERNILDINKQKIDLKSHSLTLIETVSNKESQNLIMKHICFEILQLFRF